MALMKISNGTYLALKAATTKVFLFQKVDMKRLFFLLVPIILLAGCAQMETKRGSDLSSAGVQYSTAVGALVDVAIDSMIDADSDSIVRAKFSADDLRKMPKDEQVKLADQLSQSNESLINNAKLYLHLRSSLATMQDYFTALQTLSNNPQSDATASAVSTVADRINAVSQAINSAKSQVITDAQKIALSGLSKLVADQVHGAMVGAALRRDAQIIGEALMLQQAVLKNAEMIIVDELIAKNNIFYVDNVQNPFKKQEIGNQWIADRKTYIKARAVGETSEALKSASNASKQMSKAWEKILSGVYDVSEMQQQLAEVEKMVAAAAALKQAEKNKTSSK